jgi:hypothetical protein
MEAKFGPYPLCETQLFRSGDSLTLMPPLDVTISVLTVEAAVHPGPSAKAVIVDAASVAAATI